VPTSGEVFLSLRDKDKELILPIAKQLSRWGFKLIATVGTSEYLNQFGVQCEMVKKVVEGRPHCVDRIRSGSVTLVINTTSGRRAIEDSFSIRRSCIDYFIPCVTHIDAARVIISAIERNRFGHTDVYPL
jgi:carbamoyl-phosphate synthase large subunit